MSYLETGTGIEVAPNTAHEQAEATKVATQHALYELSGEIIFADIPLTARNYLEINCPTQQLEKTAYYLRTTKAEEFGGMDNIPKDYWPMVLDDCIRATSDIEEIRVIDQEISKEEDKNAERRQSISKIKADIAAYANNQTGRDQIAAAQMRLSELISDQASGLSDIHKTELTSWLRGIATTLDQMSATINDPEEANVFEHLISSSQLHLTGDTASIVFSDLMTKIDETPAISNQTKQKLGRLVWAKTGGQVNSALDSVDASGKPLNTETRNPIQIGHGAIAYNKPDGTRAARVKLPNGRNREIPWRPEDSDDIIGLKISLAKIWTQNEWDGQTDFFGESIDIENHILSRTDPAKLRKVQLVMNALLGGMRGYDAIIIQDHEAKQVGWFNQFTSPKGDAMQGDFAQATAIENRTNLGIHPNGVASMIDYEILAEAARYSEDQFGLGEPNYYMLQQHLHELFPKKHIPLTGDNA